jgi:hypothetical protein
LITVFSATNYCGRVGNDGSVLEVDKDLVITPKIVKNKATTTVQGPQHMHRQQAQATSPSHSDAPQPPRYTPHDTTGRLSRADARGEADTDMCVRGRELSCASEAGGRGVLFGSTNSVNGVLWWCG